MPDTSRSEPCAPASPVATPQAAAFVSLVVGEERDQIPVTQYRRGYYWRCQECGWLGTGLFSLNAAMGEAREHWTKTHGGPLVAPPLVERRDQRTKAQRHIEHYRNCGCLGDSSVCCDPDCCPERTP